MSEKEQEIIKSLEWRYATKKFDASKKIAPQDWAFLEKALALSASSFGLQPYKFIVVTDPALRQALKAAAWNQGQISDASHLVVFATLKAVSPENVEHFFKRIAEVRGVPAESLKDYKAMVQGSASQLGDKAQAWTQRQAYIALGNLLTVAAQIGIDACPMEGFDPAAFDKILGLEGGPFASVVVAAVGYRAQDDGFANLKKVRLSPEELFLRK